ncbi:CIA30 family protein [Pseudoalteromonas sp. APC 3694]|uniref:CIA30 family protein n=1 Tax=Pseudoalteromonas sp. APC 3694 TaxID=3035202 RepID=UPI0025B5E497|nr:CIA30 family protein [Pseudoalteromonas sp. APC 3694]MDN3488466.1 CIA30 family protein [Pseudoalteromonas sp. APC 3694]
MTAKQLSSLFVFNLLFATTEANANARWYVVNDSVMGGISNSQVLYENDNLVFTGNVSLANNGGFASIRTLLDVQSQDITKIMLRIKGDGQTYQLRLRTNEYMDGAAYTRSFSTTKNEWLNIEFLPEDFQLTYRGRLLEQQPTISFKEIKQLGFMIAGKQAGEFRFEVEKIEFKN